MAVSEWIKNHSYLIPITVCFVSFIWFINVPFDHYDIWFERIAYGGFEQEELPQIFKDLEIPLGVTEYIEYRTTIVGRLFGMVGPVYFSFLAFGENALLWRLFLFALTFGTLFFSDRIMMLLRITVWNRIFIGLILITLFSRYYIKTISVIYGIGNLILLISFYLELKNSLASRTNLRYSYTAAALLFFALFNRELFAASIPAFLMLLFTEKKDDRIRLHFDARRLLPYIVSGLLFIALFVVLTRNKVDYAYSNDLTLSFWFFHSLKKIAYYFLNYIGFGYSPMLGAFLSVIIIILVLAVFIQNKVVKFSKFEMWSLSLSSMVILPGCLILFLIGHATGSFSHQYLFGCIFTITSFNYLLKKLSATYFRTMINLLFYSVCIMILAIRFCYSLQDVQFFSNHAKNYTRLAANCVQKIKPDDVVAFSENIGYQECYSIVTEIFIRSRMKEVKFYKVGQLESNLNGYMKYLLHPLYKLNGSVSPTIFISKCESVPRSINLYKNIRIEEEMISFFPFTFFDRHQNNFVLNLLSKLILGNNLTQFRNQYSEAICFCISY